MKRKSFVLSVLAIFIISSLIVYTILFFVNPLTQKKYNSPFSDDKGQNISQVIKVTDLEEIFTETKTTKPTSNEIIDFAKFYNDDRSIHWDDIYVNEASISDHKATLYAYNSNLYHGSVEVNYTVNDIINLESIFSGKEFNIGDIFLSPEENITKQQILEKLAIVAPECDQKYIKLLNLNEVNNNVLLAGTGLKYQGKVLLIFTIHRTTIELETKLKDKELGVIKTHWKNIPAEDQIKAAIMAKADNKGLNADYIEIDKIEKTSAQITGIGHYQGILTVNYKIDMRIDLNEHLTQKEIGTIEILESDAKKNRFFNVLMIHLLMANENLLIDPLTIKEINLNLSSTHATIVPASDQIDTENYFGSAVVHFTFKIKNK